MKTKLLYAGSMFVLTVFLTIQVKGQLDVATGKRLLETNQWNRANQFFLDQVKKNPKEASLKFYLAESYFGLDKVDSAQNNYSKSIEYPFSAAGLGKVMLTQGDTIKAKEWFTKAIKGAKKNGDLYAYIVDACIALNYPKLAEQFLLRGKEVTTVNAKLYMAAGNLAKLKGNPGGAANAYENACFYDKNLALAYVKVGLIYTDSRTWKVALQNFNNALEIDPQYPLAFKGLGEMYYKSGRFQEASLNYKKFFENSEVTLDDNYRYAFILFYNRQYAEATKMIENLLQTDSKNPVLLRLQAYISYELGVGKDEKVIDATRIQNALTNITQFFSVQSTNKFLSSDFEYLAKIQVASKLDSLAPENYKKAYEMDSTKIYCLEEGAKIYSRLDKFLKAASFYSMLLRTSPESTAANIYKKIGQQYYFEAVKNDTAKGDSLIRRTNLVLADSAFKRVATLTPTSSTGPLWMAKVEFLLDAKGEGLANQFYEKAIQLILNANESAKKKNELLEAYRCLGGYWYEKAYYAKTKRKDIKEYQEAKSTSLENWNKILELASNDPQALDGISAVNDLDKIKTK